MIRTQDSIGSPELLDFLSTACRKKYSRPLEVGSRWRRRRNSVTTSNGQELESEVLGLKYLRRYPLSIPELSSPCNSGQSRRQESASKMTDQTHQLLSLCMMSNGTNLASGSSEPRAQTHEVSENSILKLGQPPVGKGAFNFRKPKPYFKRRQSKDSSVTRGDVSMTEGLKGISFQIS